LPQSGAQLTQFSVDSQMPSPHEGHLPQSCGQPRQFSPSSQTLLPHVEQKPQSMGQLLQDSFDSHVPSPHVTGGGVTPSGKPPSGTTTALGSVKSAREPHADTIAAMIARKGITK
jgi:hypothetical protein